ncbi:MAG: hypothetical protein LBM87_02505 [Ruminococcus sp.]|jgi:hypothetical protein|nr:hypothetical protein [Ruminococcus sp.]
MLKSSGLNSADSIPSDRYLLISLESIDYLDSRDGNECYVYDVGTDLIGGEPFGDYERMYTVSVDYSAGGEAILESDYTE